MRKRVLMVMLFLLMGLIAVCQNQLDSITNEINENHRDDIVLAKSGDSEALYKLHRYYWWAAEDAENRGQKSLSESLYHISFQYLKKSAKSGSPFSCVGLGWMYESGIGTPVNYKEAFRWYNKAYEKGERSSLYHLADFYERGCAVKKDIEKAVSLYKQLVDTDKDTFASFDELHYMHLAAIRLGYIYEAGIGVPISYMQALHYYEIGAGSTEGEYILGNKYFEGVIVKQDYVKSAELFAGASRCRIINGRVVIDTLDARLYGLDSAIYMLGYMSENGLGVKQDKEKAIELYRIAAQEGHDLSKDRLKKLNMPQISVSNETIMLKVLSPRNGGQYDSKSIEIKAQIPPDASLFVEIDGSNPILLERSRAKGARVAEGEVFVVNGMPMEPGRVVNLNFMAYDSKGNRSGRERVSLRCVGVKMMPKLHVFAVGVGNYTSGDIGKLKYAAKDAKDFVTTISECNLDEFSDVSKYVYTDEKATRDEINKGFEGLLRNVKQGDVVLFFFSGHGVQDNNETYYMTVNASSLIPHAEGINFADLRNVMRKLTDRQVKVVSFMDACHAGAMMGVKGTAPKLTELDVQNVIEFYSSTNGEESAEDDRLQNGVFTAGLISGLKGAAANADGYVTVNTLRIYLSDYIRERNSRQTPVFNGVNAGDITLFRMK